MRGAGVIHLLRILGAGLVVQLCLFGALLALLSLAGWWNGWLDVLASFAPIWLIVCLLGAAVAWPALPPGVREPALAAAAAGVLACVLMMAPELLRSTAPARHGEKLGQPLKVLTFNVWDDNRHAALTADAILASGADVVALQEFFGLTALETDRLQAAYPYRAQCPAGCDLLLMSKRPWLGSTPEAAQRDPGDVAIWAQTTAPDGRPVTILTTHYPWPGPPRSQRRARQIVAHDVAGLAKDDLIVTGDFNLTPWTAALKRQDHEFAPLVRRTRAVYSWPAWIARLDAPAPFAIFPIDQFYAGPDWRTLAVQRLRRAGSDHYGVMVTLARP